MATEPEDDDDDSLTEKLAKSAAGPRQVTVQGMGSSEEHSLTDQIAAAKFLGTTRTAKRVGGGIRFSKATAGGAVQ